IGEFAFVLMRFGAGYDLIDARTGDVFLAASILTMLITPLVLAASRPLLSVVRGWEERGWWRPARDLTGPPDELSDLEGHVIVVGYGFNGRNLARVLREIGIPHVALDMNAEAVRAARGEGERIVYGDATSPGMLDRVRSGR